MCIPHVKVPSVRVGINDFLVRQFGYTIFTYGQTYGVLLRFYPLTDCYIRLYICFNNGGLKALCFSTQPHKLITRCFLLLQLYLRRLKLCKNAQERKYFEQINELYMTEESDDSDGTCF